MHIVLLNEVKGKKKRKNSKRKEEGIFKLSLKAHLVNLLKVSFSGTTLQNNNPPPPQ
jgi:hypothetical protein